MLLSRGFARLAFKDFIHCGLPRPLRATAAAERDNASRGGDRDIRLAVDGRDTYEPSSPTTATAALATSALATAAETSACMEESKGILQQHFRRFAQACSLQGPSGLRCCCLLSRGIVRAAWANPAAAIVSMDSAVHQQNASRGQRGLGFGNRQSGTETLADTPNAMGVLRRSNSNSSRRGSSASSEFGEVYGPRAREGIVAAVAGGSRGVSVERAACAAATAGAAPAGRPPLLSATPAAVRHIKELIKGYNEALQQQQQRDGEPPPKATGIRIGLQRQGCSGMAYDVTLCTERRSLPNNGYTTGPAAARPAAGPSHGPGTLRLASRKGKDWGEDEVVEIDGVEIRVAADAVMLLIGTEVDFVDEDVQTGFIFNNPNQKQSCGCGKSFMV